MPQATNLNTDPYYDDFDVDKKFHRILYRPGRAVQARELTQQQSILQNQIERFANHIFKDGSIVSGGNTTYNNNLGVVKLQTATISGDSSLTLKEKFDGRIITQTDGDVKGRVVLTLDSTTLDSETLLVEYLTGSPANGFLTSNTISTTIETGDTVDYTATVLGSLTEDNVGVASIASIDDSTFYISGHFVKIDKQSVSLHTIDSDTSKRIFTDTPNKLVGLQISEQLINENDDASLNDPSQGSFNYAAPGADRLKIQACIISNDIDGSTSLSNTSDENFISLMLVVNGVIQEQTKIPTLSDIEERLAWRTREESGNYTVDGLGISVNDSKRSKVFVVSDWNATNFTAGETVEGATSGGTGKVITKDDGTASWNSTKLELGVKAILDGGAFSTSEIITGTSGASATISSSRSDKLDIKIDGGIAYVRGHRVYTQSPKVITIDKARDTASINGELVSMNYSSYVIVGGNEFSTAGITTGIVGLFDSSEAVIVNLYDAHSDTIKTGDGIGTAKVRHIEYDSGTPGPNGRYRMYLYDIVITGTNKSFANVKHISDELTDGLVGAFANVPTAGEDSGGNTQLTGTSNNRLIFPTLSDSVVPGIMSDITYQHKRRFANEDADTNLQIEIEIDSSEAFNGYITGGGLVQPARYSNFMAVNRATNAIVNIDSITFPTATTALLTFASTDVSATNTISVIGTINIGPLSSVQRSKTLVENKTVSDLTLIDNKLQLGYADVYSLTKILDGSGEDVTSKFTFDDGQRGNFYDHAAASLVPGETVTGDFAVTFDYFEHIGTGFLTVDSYDSTQVSYEDIPQYKDSSTGEMFELRNVIDFRPKRRNDGTDLVGVPVRPSTVTDHYDDDQPFAVNKIIFPTPSTNFSLDYQYYTSRIDKIAIDEDRNFISITGASALDPAVPADRELAMTLYTLRIPSYTFNTSDVGVTSHDNRRFTMRDIGKIKQRIDRLEYYTSLSLLEEHTKNLLIKDADGNDRFKNGMLVDSFGGHGVGDVTNSDYNISIDFENKEMRPPFTSENVKLEYFSTEEQNTLQTGNLITVALNSSESSKTLIDQPLASKAISVNSFGGTIWVGELTLDPSSAVWFSQETRPDVITNEAGENDAWLGNTNKNGFGTQWNDWEISWIGKEYRTHPGRPPEGTYWKDRQTNYTLGRFQLAWKDTGETVNPSDINRGRLGIQNEVIPGRINTEVGSRTVNKSIVPFIRAQTISFSATGMKPFTVVYPFFDDTDVSGNVTPAILKTDKSGAVSGTFSIPADIYRTGNIQLRLTDQVNNVLSSTTSAAETMFKAAGAININDPVVRRTCVTSDDVPSSRVEGNNYQSKQDSTLRNYDPPHHVSRRKDPLAQTIFIDPAVYPGGVFLKHIDLFFKTKDETLPVTLEIRPVESGFPHSYEVLPHSQVVVNPSNVNISDEPSVDTSTTRTRFTFSSPIFLTSNDEYALVVLTNSSKYEIWVAEMGQNNITGNNRISTQPYTGSLFKSQNTSTWTPEQNEDLMFQIERYKFRTGTINDAFAIFKNVQPTTAAGIDNDVKVDTINITTGQMEPPGTSLIYSARTSNEAAAPTLEETFSTNILPFENINFDRTKQISSADGQGTFQLKAVMQTDDDAVSPIIDVSRMSAIAIENLINNNTNEDTNGESGSDSARAKSIVNGGSNARYITRRVNLATGFEADDLKVYLTVNKPLDATIKVYYKVLSDQDSTPFDDRPWDVMVIDGSEASTSKENEFLEVVYKPNLDDIAITYNSGTVVATGGNAGFDTFKSFAIKVNLFSSNGAKVPRVKDLRAIALAPSG